MELKSTHNLIKQTSSNTTPTAPSSHLKTIEMPRSAMNLENDEEFEKLEEDGLE